MALYPRVQDQARTVDGSGTYAGKSTISPGAVLVALGDSTTLAGESPPATRGESWPVYATLISGGQLQYAHNAGVYGNTTANMLARFATDVTPYAPSVVTILGGTNDIGNNIPLATTQANIIAMVAATRAINAVPVLCTILPRYVGIPANDKQLVIQLNGWIKGYAALNNITVIDFYSVMTDPATGQFFGGGGDGIHPGPSGYRTMGNYAWSVLSTVIAANQGPMICQSDLDDNNMVTGGCFTTGSGSSLLAGWSDAAGIPSGNVLSYVTDTLVPGKLLRLTSTATAALRQLSYGMYFTGGQTLSGSTIAGATSITINGTSNPVRAVLFIGSGATAEVVKAASVSGGSGAWVITLSRALVNAHAAGEAVTINGVPGDVIAFSGRVTNDTGGVPITTKVQFSGGSAFIPMQTISQAVTRGVFSQRYVVPDGTTSVTVSLQVNPGTGVSDFGQIGLYNATQLGI